LVTGLVHPSDAEDKTVRLASLDWPPYTMAGNINGGAELVVRRAFEAMGYRLVVEVLPWNRAVYNATNAPAFDGYFPEYWASAAEKTFFFSRPIGRSPLGFAERKAEPVAWQRLDDLAGIRIGTVSGYINTDEFDTRAKAGGLSVEEALSDSINLRKLARGRIRLAVIDRNVMDVLLANDPGLMTEAKELRFNDRMLEEKDLFVCFRRDDRGREMARILNEGLRRIDATALMRERLSVLSGRANAAPLR
jgi:polar amino acid transport system substrate-binding protein